MYVVRAARLADRPLGAFFSAAENNYIVHGFRSERMEPVVCPFVLFLLAIVLFVLLRYTDCDNPFYIFKLFLYTYNTPLSR